MSSPSIARESGDSGVRRFNATAHGLCGGVVPPSAPTDVSEFDAPRDDIERRAGADDDLFSDSARMSVQGILADELASNSTALEPSVQPQAWTTERAAPTVGPKTSSQPAARKRPTPPSARTAIDADVLGGHDVNRTHDAVAERERRLAELASSVAARGFRIARDLLGNRAQAEDAVQEALARACEQSGRLRDPRAIEGWYFRVLTNLCMRILRRRRLRRLFLGRERAVEPREPSTDDRLDAYKKLVQHEHSSQLLRALDVLPAKQRTALLLRYGHDLSVAEIADMLDVRPATVKTHLVRGLRRLRKTMESRS